eukprot:529308-Rhodomonas_salina.1
MLAWGWRALWQGSDTRASVRRGRVCWDQSQPQPQRQWQWQRQRAVDRGIALTQAMRWIETRVVDGAEGDLRERVWVCNTQAWFMEGKEGKEYKPNSFYQILRRLGFFPTLRSSRAGHGYDFEASSTFQWDSERKYIQRRRSARRTEGCSCCCQRPCSADGDRVRLRL